MPPRWTVRGRFTASGSRGLDYRVDAELALAGSAVSGAPHSCSRGSGEAPAPGLAPLSCLRAAALLCPEQGVAAGGRRESERELLAGEAASEELGEGAV